MARAPRLCTPLMRLCIAPSRPAARVVVCARGSLFASSRALCSGSRSLRLRRAAFRRVALAALGHSSSSYLVAAGPCGRRAPPCSITGPHVRLSASHGSSRCLLWRAFGHYSRASLAPRAVVRRRGRVLRRALSRLCVCGAVCFYCPPTMDGLGHGRVLRRALSRL